MKDVEVMGLKLGQNNLEWDWPVLAMRRSTIVAATIHGISHLNLPSYPFLTWSLECGRIIYFLLNTF